MDSADLWQVGILILTWLPVGYLWTKLLRLVHFSDWEQRWVGPAGDGDVPEWFFTGMGWALVLVTVAITVYVSMLMLMSGVVVLLKKLGWVSSDYQLK